MIFCRCPDTRPFFNVQEHSYSVCSAFGALIEHGYQHNFLLAPWMLALGLYWKYACSESRLGVLENRPNRFIECRST